MNILFFLKKSCNINDDTTKIMEPGQIRKKAALTFPFCVCHFFMGEDVYMDEIYMKEAIVEAQKAFNNGDVPVGAIIVRNDQIIARSYNCKESTKNPLDHAELIAIKQASNYIGDWRLNDCTMYVTLKPCMMCLGAILESRIKKIVYGTTVIKEQDTSKLIIEGNVMEVECKDILQEFFKKRRNS